MFGLAYVYLDQLKFCGVCVDGLGYVYVCECYVALDECAETPSMFVFPVCACGGVVRHFGCFCVSFVYCIVMMSPVRSCDPGAIIPLG